jgi:RNA polymerase-binding transcription factor DksA
MSRQSRAESAIVAARISTATQVESLTSQWTGIVEASALSVNDDEHDPEGVTVAFERAQVQSLLDQARADLVDLDRAALRVADGTYWTCVRCAGPIAQARLAALPAASTCITCANAARR